jgi:hypothetical protein
MISVQCYRCYYTDCTAPNVCNFTQELISALRINGSLNILGILPCPATAQELNDSRYIEIARFPGSACGKRTFKVFATEYSTTNGLESQTVPVALSPSSTSYPILNPPYSPVVHEYTFTLFGVTNPTADCNEDLFSKRKYNKTLDSGLTLEFEAYLKNDSSDCYQCTNNFCNQEFISIAAPTEKPTLPGNSGNGNGGSTSGSTSAMNLLPNLFLFCGITSLLSM